MIIALLFVFLSLFPDPMSSKWVSLALCLIYMVSFWYVYQLSSTRMLSVLFALLYVVSLVFWFAFDENTGLLLSLQGFLISYIALMLPNWTAVIQSGSILLITFLVRLSFDGQSWEGLLSRDFFFYAGLFAMCRLIRQRRIREQERFKFTEELTLMHSELEGAHLKLRQAHEELELATEKSLRYAVIEERSRIARDLHDSIGHRLTSVIVQLQALPYVLKTNKAETEKIVKTVLNVARSCLQEVRLVVHNMEKDECGTDFISLRNLVQQTASSSSLEIQLEMNERVNQEKWPLDISVALYRMIQEALTNTIRHANAYRVDIRVNQHENEVEICYRDDGKLMPNSVWQEGFGLTGIRKRCENLNGSCYIGAQDPHGMTLDIWLPLTAIKEEHTHG
ncbi:MULTISPECIES: ATP-binding protein [Paenibacillus]|uniref:ATP-binding protein n=1 Tax=Paenibacillus TaxID=44249 RepID=UPI0015C3A9EF|nr:MULTISPECIES: sensor histidine kinase [Paenibacillus]